MTSIHDRKRRASTEATVDEKAPPSGPSMNRLQIEYVPIGQLVESARKLRRHDKKQLKLLAQSLSTYGFAAPAIVKRDLSILDGHALVEAARQAGFVEVPVVRIEHLDEQKERALRITLNRLAELASWDEQALGLELGELFELNLSPSSASTSMSRASHLLSETG